MHDIRAVSIPGGARGVRAALLLALAVLAGCAHQDEWTSGDTVLQGILIATVAADAYQTTKIQDHPNIVENGTIARAFMGSNPSTSDVLLYMGTVSISQYLIARALPQGWRTIFQVGNIWIHGQAVNQGQQIGLWATPCTRNQEEHPCP